MKKGRRRLERRKRERRRLLTESEFRRLIETGKTSKSDRRAWVDRRKPKALSNETDVITERGSWKNEKYRGRY